MQRQRLYTVSAVLSDLLEDILIPGQPATHTVIGVGHFTIDGYLEDAAVSLFQVWYNPEFLFDSCRQTGGCSKEASLHTVSDLNLGRLSSFRCLAHGSLLFIQIHSI